MAKVKCAECEKMIEKEEGEKYKNRYYCLDKCIDIKKERESKNTDGWDDLFQYMKKLYGEVDTKMITLVAKYRKEPYNYTNKGMELTLYYYHELLENATDKEAVGIIPYYYDRAKEEYIINMDIHEHNSSIEFMPHIKKLKINPTKNIKQNQKNIIDLNTLGVSENNE